MADNITEDRGKLEPLVIDREGIKFGDENGHISVTARPLDSRKEDSEKLFFMDFIYKGRMRPGFNPDDIIPALQTLQTGLKGFRQALDTHDIDIPSKILGHTKTRILFDRLRDVPGIKVSDEPEPLFGKHEITIDLSEVPQAVRKEKTIEILDQVVSRFEGLQETAVSLIERRNERRAV